MILSKIIIYPIKSLDGVEVQESRITSGGILEFDRIYAIVDESGAYVNGKRTARIHQLRSSFDPALKEVCLWENGESSQQFPLEPSDELNQWLSVFFGFEVRLIMESKSGFPDDKTAFGPTVISEASLKAVTEWFPDLNLESARRRFRTNLEIAGSIPFWEDNLYSAPNELKLFRVGEVQFYGHNPCQRCVVPARDPDHGDSVTSFQKTFMEQRRKLLPAWAEIKRFNHYYRFAVNTSIPDTEAEKSVRVGDLITIDTVVPSPAQ